jgi:hypothetical protein
MTKITNTLPESQTVRKLKLKAVADYRKVVSNKKVMLLNSRGK